MYLPIINLIQSCDAATLASWSQKAAAAGEKGGAPSMAGPWEHMGDVTGIHSRCRAFSYIREPELLNYMTESNQVKKKNVIQGMDR